MPNWLRNATLLVVDSDFTSSGLKMRVLTERGFNCHEATTARDALRLLRVIRFDLLLVSMYLPDQEATTLCRDVRKGHSILILVCGQDSDPYDEVACLDAGADDYIMSPINPSVLVARVRALLRRVMPVSHVRQGDHVGDLVIDEGRFQVFHHGVPLKLTTTEFKILKLLASKPDHAMTRDAILTHVWNTTYLGDKRVVDTHIRNLRRKLNDVKSSVLIHSVRGVGYRIVAGADSGRQMLPSA